MIAQINQFIDTVQGTKSQFINTFVKEKTLREPLHSFVDAQTQFAKAATKSVVDFVNEATKEVVKFDATKAFATK